MNKHTHALNILRRLKDAVWKIEDDKLSGTIDKLTLEDIDYLKLLESNGEISSLKRDSQCSADDLNIDDDIYITIKTAELRIYKDFEHVISKPVNLVTFEPFIIYDGNISLFDTCYSNSDNKDFRVYSDILMLIGVLKKIANEYDNGEITHSVVFWYNSKKHEIKIQYSYDVFSQLSTFDFHRFVKELDSAFSNNSSLYDKKIIFKKVFYKTYDSLFLHETPPNSIFIIFMKNIEHFCRDFSIENEVSLSQFSYEKLKNEALEKESNYKKRLNDTFSNIQGKIIAIPVVSMIAIGQMVDGNGCKNIALFIGTCIVNFLIYLALRMQYENLKYIEREVNSEKEELKKYPHVNSYLTDNYTNISKHIGNHKKLIYMFWGILFISFCVTFRFLYLYW